MRRDKRAATQGSSMLGLASGVYFYRLQVADFVDNEEVVVVEVRIVLPLTRHLSVRFLF
jgi:hypothetical protein